MRIAIDARAFSWTGVGRYIRNLLVGLSSIPTKDKYVVLIGKQDIAAFHAFKKDVLSNRFQEHIVTSDYYSLSEQTLFLRQLQSVKADLFHFTHFNVPIGFRKPFVVTIHDVTRFIYPGQQRQSLVQQVAYEYVFQQAVKRAQVVISVCETTEQELRDLPLARTRPIKVVHEGVDDSFRQTIPDVQRSDVRSFLRLNGPYILYVGVWMNHKNLHRLLIAFKEVLKQFPDLKLVITGDIAPGYVDLYALVTKLHLKESVILPGFVPQALLPALYAEAKCFIYPSLYEGFGLPPLEAAACGTPVVTSLVSTMPEIMGDAAVYVNPESVDDIARGIILVMQDSYLQQTLKEKGIERVKQFSWKTCAQKTVQIYQEALNIT